MLNIKNWDIKTTLWSFTLGAVAFGLLLSTSCSNGLRQGPPNEDGIYLIEAWRIEL
jgi:hypothetical protein